MILPSINQLSSYPVYLQIKDSIKHAIHVKPFAPDEKIPSVRQLCQQTGASRMTVLRAVHELVSEGELYTVSGKGTFVARPPQMETNIQKTWGFSDTFLSQGHQPSSQLLSLSTIPADKQIAPALKIKTGEDIYRLERVRFLDLYPMGVEVSCLPCKKFPRLEQFEWNTHSLYQVLRDHYHTSLAGGEQYVEAGGAAETIAHSLRIPKNTPILILKRTTISTTGEPVEFVCAYYRSDHVRLKLHLTSDDMVNIISAKG